MNISKFHRLHIVACALEEEIQSMMDYVKQCSDYQEIEIPQLCSFIKNDAAPPYITKRLGDIYIFTHTAHGKQSSIYINTLLEKCLSDVNAGEIDVRVLYAGSCLGISPSLKKNDVCMISDFYEYEKMDDFSSFSSMQMKPNESIENMTVALTGTHFIRVANEYAKGKSGYEVLPESARLFIEHAPTDTLHFILDMETAHVGKICRTFTGNGHNVSFECLRVVLDSVFDKDKINYWKEIKEISKIIKKELLQLL